MDTDSDNDFQLICIVNFRMVRVWPKQLSTFLYRQAGTGTLLLLGGESIGQTQQNQNLLLMGTTMNDQKLLPERTIPDR